MSDEAMLPICRHCGVNLEWATVVVGEWVHVHGSVFCRDNAWKYTRSPVTKAAPTVFALPPRVTR